MFFFILLIFSTSHLHTLAKQDIGSSEFPSDYSHPFSDILNTKLKTEPLDLNNTTNFFRDIILGEYDKVDQYLKQGMNPNTRFYTNPIYGSTALIRALGGRRIAISELLIKKGADLNLATQRKGISNITPLMIASMLGPTKIITLLLKNGAEVNTTTTGVVVGQTALSTAVQYQQAEIVTILLANGADPNILIDGTPIKNMSILMLAILTNNIYIIEQLLQQKTININQIDSEGRNALVYAYIAGNIKIIELLTKKGLTTNFSPQELQKIIKTYLEEWFI